MTNLSDTLAALSEAVTQGEWVIELDPYDAPFPGICPAGSPFEMASFTMGEDADENQANANFVVALVSAYRTGQLVPVPSVERVAREFHAAHMVEKGELAAWTWEEANKGFYSRIATAVIAAMQEDASAYGRTETNLDE